MIKTVLLTGSNGFVGAGVLRYLLENTNWNFLLPTTALHHGSQTRLNQVFDSYNHVNWGSRYRGTLDDRVTLVRCDLTQPFTHTIFRGAPKPDYVLNIASESHVDRSLTDPAPFIRNNVDLMVNVLEYAREVKPTLVLHMSTDEVYGNAREGESHVEWDPVRPSNPYSASKAAQEAIAYSYWRSFGVPLIITNTMNLIAPASYTYQSTEKFVPMVVKRLLADEEVAIHVDENGESGSRCWIDVRDFADAWLFLIENYADAAPDPNLKYYPNQPHKPLKFNIVGPEASNEWIAASLAVLLGIDNPRLVASDFHSQRPGHDARYSLDGGLLTDHGWEAKRPLVNTLQDIVFDYKRYPELLD